MAIRIFEMGSRTNGAQPIRPVPFLAEQSKAVSGTSAQSDAFAAGTKMVTLQADAACHVVFGSNPTATTTDFKMNADQTYDFEVQKGHKVAFIAAA